MYELTKRVWAVRQWRNMLFPPVLLLLALLNSASYWSADDPILSTQLHYGAVWMITVLVVIIGGRVTPLFTGNRLGMKIAPLPNWFENLAIGSTVLIGLLTALGLAQQQGGLAARDCAWPVALFIWRDCCTGRAGRLLLCPCCGQCT